MTAKFIAYLAFPFVQNALAVGTLIALSASLLGVPLVIKRFSVIGDGLSHVAFGALAIASVLKMTNQMAFVVPATVLCAVMLLGASGKSKAKGDAAVAMISASALAVGYLLMNVFSVSSNISGDVCSTLFGSTSILTLKRGDVVLCAVLSAAVLLTFSIFYNRIFLVTFDADFASATGTSAKVYNYILAALIALVIVAAMQLVGSLLISALVVFPALSAMKVFKTFRAVTIASAAFGSVCALAGISASILAGTPVGSTIVAANIILFFICSALGRK